MAATTGCATWTPTAADPWAAMAARAAELDASEPGWRERARAWTAERWEACEQEAADRARRCLEGRSGVPAPGAAPDAAEGAAGFAADLAAGRYRGAWVFGGCGTGKTAWPGAVGRAWDALRPAAGPARMVGDADLFDEVAASFDGEGAAAVVARYAACGLLVVDDLGKAAWGDRMAGRLFALVDARWRAGRPTVVTSNLAPSGWAAQAARRGCPPETARAVVDRLRQGARLVERRGPSMRGGWLR